MLENVGPGNIRGRTTASTGHGRHQWRQCTAHDRKWRPPKVRDRVKRYVMPTGRATTKCVQSWPHKTAPLYQLTGSSILIGFLEPVLPSRQTHRDDDTRTKAHQTPEASPILLLEFQQLHDQPHSTKQQTSPQDNHLDIGEIHTPSNQSRIREQAQYETATLLIRPAAIQPQHQHTKRTTTNVVHMLLRMRQNLKTITPQTTPKRIPQNSL